MRLFKEQLKKGQRVMPIETQGYIRLSRVVVVVNFNGRESRKAPQLGTGFLATLDGGTIYSVCLATSISFENVCGILGTLNCYITCCVYMYINSLL